MLTPARFDPAAFAPLLAAALDAGDVAAVQLRLKPADDAQLCRAIDTLRPIAQARDVAFLVNDRPDLAVSMGCDGAHVGQIDMAVAEARLVLGDALMLGATCHASRDLAMRAGEAGADYVAFGAFFPSATKPEAPPCDLDLLRWWSALMTLPVVAIGGIDADNCAELVRAGADFLAVSGAVWGCADGSAAAIRRLNAAIAGA